MAVDSRLLWMALGGFVGANEGFAIGSLLPAISADMGVSIGQAGLVVFFHALAYAIGTPVLSTVFGRLNRRSLLVGAETAFAGLALLMALAPSFEWVVAARVGLALAVGLFTATAYATAVALSAPERRGRAVGIVASGQSLAVVVGVPTAAFVAVSFGWQLVYFGIAALAAVAALALRRRLPADIPGDVRPLGERLRVLQIPGVPLLLAMMLTYMLAVFLPLTYVAPLARHAAGLDPGGLPMVLLANGIGAVAGSNLGGRITDALGARRTVIAVSFASVLVLLALMAVPGLPPMLAPWGFMLGMAVLGFFAWSYWPAHCSLMAGAAGPSAPLGIALNLTALNIGVALCASLGGAALDSFGGQSLMLIAVPFSALALGLAAVTTATPRAPVTPSPQSVP
jgi:predicted MFS family arabinose efflux permease